MTTTANTPSNGSNGSTNGSENLLEPGVRKARPVEGTLTHTTSKPPKTQYAVRFQILEGADAGKHVTWWGGFEGQGFRYTTSALMLMGWDGKTSPALFKPSKDVIIVLEHHTIPATPQKPARKVTRVKYINALDGSGNALEKMKLKPEEAQAAGDAILARMMAGEGGTPTNGGAPMGGADPNAFTAGAPEGAPEEDLPF